MTGPLAGKTVYIPDMADHAHVVAAAMRAHGLDARVLDPPDDESLALGLDVCRGRECLPCFLATGDILRECRRPGFDDARSAFLMTMATGPCRFGQYNVLQRAILARAGHGDVEILTPSSENLYRGLGDDPGAIRRLAWHGIVAVDLLLKLRYEYRPYELESGVVEGAYHASLADCVAATGTGDADALLDAMRGIAERFRALPVRRDPPRPLVAMLGEIYVMLNDRANQQMIRKLEALGAEVVTGGLTDFMLFSDQMELGRNRLFHEWRKFVGNVAQDGWQRLVLHRFERIVAPLLRHPLDPTIAELFRLLRPAYDPMLGTEATLMLGRALWESRQGISGVVNVVPFSCMPGILISAMAPALREAMGQLPWLDVWYDAQQQTNVHTRLEAFMHQVRQHAERRPAPAALMADR